MAGQPEYCDRVVLRIAEVATDGACVGDYSLYLGSFVCDTPLEATKIVKGIHAHRDLLDPVWILKRRSPADQRDPVVTGLWVGAEECS